MIPTGQIKLKTKLVAIFLSISIAAIIAVALINFIHTRMALEHQVLDHLQSVSRLQEERITSAVREMHEELNVIVGRLTLKARFRNLLEQPTSENLKLMNQSLTSAIIAPTFKRGMAMDTLGRVLASTDTAYIGRDYGQMDFFFKGKQGITIDNFFLDPENKPMTMMAAPLIWKDRLIGVIAIESTLEEIERIVGDYTGLGETGETILVMATEQGDALFIAPVRYDPQAALRRIIPRSETENPAFSALAGREELITEATDYNHHRVYASTRYIEQTGWGLISKMGASEVLAPVRQIKWLFLLTILIAAVFISTLVVYMVRRITVPINELIVAAKKTRKKDYSYKVPVKSQDELGELAMTFNRMNESLKMAMEELKRRMSELELVNRELEQFAYIVSHDLKAPLQGIELLTNSIIEDHMSKLGKDGVEEVNLLRDKVRRTENMIAAILQYSRVGRIRGEEKEMDLNKEVVDIVDSLQPPAHINIKVEQKLPVIYCEPVPVIQVFLNLISNAIKYIDKPRGVIKIGYREQGDFLVFYVKDNGPGIEEKYYEKIFEVFQTVHKPSPDSTGIGLAIVKKGVQSLGGKVWVESEIGKGSTFYFTLPKRLLVERGDKK